jgi:hypothetical protein
MAASYLGWPIAASYMSPNGGGGRVAGSQPMSTAVCTSPNKQWRSNPIFNLWLRVWDHPISSSASKIYFEEAFVVFLISVLNVSITSNFQHVPHFTANFIIYCTLRVRNQGFAEDHRVFLLWVSQKIAVTFSSLFMETFRWDWLRKFAADWQQWLCAPPPPGPLSPPSFAQYSDLLTKT